MLFTMPEECTALGGAGPLPLTVEWVSFLPGGRQAFGGRDRVALAQALALELDAMCTVNDAVQNRIAQGRIANDFVPSRHWHLAHDQQRAPLITIVDDLQ